MNLRLLPSLLLPLALAVAVGCADNQGGDADEAGGNYGGTTGTGPGDGGGPVDPGVVTSDGSTTTGASGSGGGGAAAIEALCDQAPPAPTTVELSYHGHPSTAGAQYARATLLRPEPVLPDPTLLQAEDFLSFYGLDPASVAEHVGGPLGVRWHQTGKPDVSKSGVLELDFVTPPGSRDPIRLVVLVDVSQSLSQSMGLLGDSVRALGRGIAQGATPGDTMAVVSFAGDVAIEVEGEVKAGVPYGGLPLESLALAPRGGNDFVSAVREAIKVAENASTSAHIVLLTDAGTTADAGLLDAIRNAAAGGTRLSVAQVAIELPSGPAPLARGFLDAVASAGRGGQFYVSHPSDADRAFDRRFGPSFGVYARAALARVSLPPLLRAVGLPEPVTGSADGPSGGLLAANGVHPLRIGLEATCPAVFTEEVPGLAFYVNVSGEVAGVPGDLASMTKDWLQLRGPSPITERNDAILAVAQALRSRSQKDIDAARQALAVVTAGECLECDQVLEIEALLSALELLVSVQ